MRSQRIDNCADEVINTGVSSRYIQKISELPHFSSIYRRDKQTVVYPGIFLSTLTIYG